jgi:hypothetical protein
MRRSSAVSRPVTVLIQWLSWQPHLQLDHPAGGVVHLLHGQSQPVPQKPQPFASGPAARLFQMPDPG